MGLVRIIGTDPNGANKIIVQTDLIKAETEKIDNAASDGLTGVSGSLAYEVGEIERHHHNYEKWFGLAAIPAAETHRADRITLNPAPFQADAGNDDWGAWLQVLGSDDTPVIAGSAKYDFHEVLIVDHETNTQTYFMQVACGESADLAAILVAETFTELTLKTGGGTSETAPIEFLDRRMNAGSKCWVRILAPGINTSTLDFFIALHEYAG